MRVARLVLAVGMVGMIDASMTHRPVVLWTKTELGLEFVKREW